MPSVRSSQTAFRNTAASTTDDPIVAAKAGQRIRVLAVAIVAGTTAAAVTFNTKPAGAGSAISAAFTPAASTPCVLPASDGWFQTNVGEGLSVTTGGSVTAVAIQVSYTLVS